MKIGILNNAVPFVRGGAEHLADALRAKLCEYGHQALLVRIPFRWDTPSKILEHMLACRLMRMPGCDRVKSQQSSRVTSKNLFLVFN